ncbi:uracil-DNA glycosylase family protein [Epibacterium sp. SM1979]|uniref:Uracil-DNA glycosylase family protein n=1 Tax=Tritonibacter litoralis TaxID=2662264 RepID=A0A843YAC2_9RHOB|nr:uracil-DNA glycosylase family protein [Tritonibacter litoralis]MQQ07941.1 uracil-DNA glycosylase family protein [Tritonibacter litoralis]
MQDNADPLVSEIAACRACADRFAATHTGHRPNPVVWFRSSARILIAGQAPGLRVHEIGRPFADASGDRLRAWLGMSPDQFYELSRVAVVPMAFCFPGYNAKGSDLPPPPQCARLWHDKVFETLPNIRLRILVGGYAQKFHLKLRGSVTETVRNWRDIGPDVFPLPHPSWRNTAWLRKNPWFGEEVLPALRARVKEAMGE